MKTALIRGYARPAHLAAADGRLVQVGGVPVERQAAAEIPAPRDAFIAVEIHHLHDHPLRPGFMLVLRIDHALGVVRIVEIDDMTADMVRRAVELTRMGLLEPRAQRLESRMSSASEYFAGS